MNMFFPLESHLALSLLVLALISGFFIGRYGPESVSFNSDLLRIKFGEKLVLISVVFTGAAIRFYGLDFGFPNFYHPDEQKKLHFLKDLLETSSLDRRYTLHPPLLLYLSAVFSKFLSAFDFSPASSMLNNLLAGRMVIAICGTISIALIFFVARSFSSVFVALISSALLAFSPLHITSSRYMKEDALFVMFLLACVYYVFKYVLTRRSVFYYFAGLLAGLAFGSKYTGLLCLAIISAVPFLSDKEKIFSVERQSLKHFPFAVLFMLLGFVLVNPNVFTSFGDIWDGFRHESRHAMTGHFGISIDPWSQYWMFHLARSIVPGIGLLPAFLALLGMGILMARLRSLNYFLIGLILLFYLPAEIARSKPPPQPDRYILPVLPFLAITAGICIERVFFRMRHIGRVFIAAVVLFFPLWRSLQLASEIRLDTRKQMTDWMADNLPDGSRILTAGGKNYLPRIPQKFKQTSLRKKIGREKLAIVEKLKETRYDFLIVSDMTENRFSSGSLAKSPSRVAYERIDQAFPVANKTKARYGSYGFHNPTLTLYSLR